MNQSKSGLTNYERVARFNHIAGNAFGEGWPKLEKQLKIIKSERKELDDGIENRDLKEVVDGSADELVTVYGMLYRVGLNGDDVMAEVLDALETRFDTTLEDAQKTVEKYRALNVEVEIRPCTYEGVDYYVVKSTIDQVGNNGEEYAQGKWLKSYQFREPNFEKLFYPELLARLELTIPV